MAPPLSKADWRVFKIWLSQLDEPQLTRVARFRHMIASDVDFGFLISLVLEDLVTAAHVIRNEVAVVQDSNDVSREYSPTMMKRRSVLHPRDDSVLGRADAASDKNFVELNSPKSETASCFAASVQFGLRLSVQIPPI